MVHCCGVTNLLDLQANPACICPKPQSRHLSCPAGQGLSLEGGTVRLASPEVFASFRALRSASDAWKGTWAGGSPAAACSTDPSSPCGRANANDLALLEVAASPAAYDASKLRGPGGTPLFLPAGDQRPCFSCVGFAVAAAARAAYVSALPDGAEGSVPGISEHDLQHCGSGAWGKTWSISTTG